MHRYLNTVADALAEPLVGGSQECLRIVQEGHAAIGDMLRAREGREKLADLFDVCGGLFFVSLPERGGKAIRQLGIIMYHCLLGADALEKIRARQSFAGFGVIQIDVQSNDPSCRDEGCNIGSICKMLTAVPTYVARHPFPRLKHVFNAEPCVCYPLLHASDGPVESLARVSSKLRGHECHNGANAGTDEDQALMNTEQRNGDRVWTYQTCTEFGFFQTCEVGSRCPYAQGYLPLSKYLDKCEAAFGLAPEQVLQAIQLSNEYYGADRYLELKLLSQMPWCLSNILTSARHRPRGARILFANGQIDPWSASSVRVSPDPKMEPTLWVPGASHHAWTHPSKDDDQLTVL